MPVGSTFCFVGTFLIMEIPVRGKILMVAAAAVLSLTSGCGNRDSEVYPREQARASAPRTNLYPLTTPPPGSVQPLQGYAPTRITASYADGYTAPPPANAGYNPGYNVQPAGYVAGSQQGGYVQSGIAAPGPGYAGDPFAGVVQNPFTPNGGVCRVEEITAYSNPTVPIQDPPVVVNRVDITTPYPGGVNTYAAMNSGYQTPATSGGYTSPSLSARARYNAGAPRGGAYGPYDTSAYGSSSYQNHPTGLHYGPVEGTADIVTNPAAIGLIGFSSGYGPVGSAYPTAPRTGAPAPMPPPPGSPAARYSGGAYPAVATTIPATYAPAPAAQAPMAAGYNVGEIRLVPATDIPPGFHPNDAGPSQWFEIVRPGNGPLRIGRVSATCVCVGVRVPNRHIAAGERALVEARIVSRPQVNNLTYGIYVNIVEPQQTVVDADVTISL